MANKMTLEERNRLVQEYFLAALTKAYDDPEGARKAELEELQEIGTLGVTLDLPVPGASREEGES